MKTTLTADDASGWYLVEFRGRTYARWWDGESFRRDPGGIRYGTPYVNVRRALTCRDVAAFSGILRTALDAGHRFTSAITNASSELIRMKGPIPVVVEQQPPRVVKVRNRKDAEVCQAIFSPCFSTLVIINDDGSFRATEFSHNWEEVQS